MKHLLTFLSSLICVQSFSQVYTIDFGTLKTSGVITPPTMSDQKVQDATIDKAAVVITNVTSGEEAKIELQYANNPSKKVDQKTPVVTAGTVTFELKSHIGPAKSTFKLLYGGHPNAIIQFDDQTTAKKPKEEDPTLTNYLAGVANLNFIGNNKFLSNLTPVVFLGNIIELKTKSFDNGKGHFAWKLDINPYLGAQINTKDSMAFIPALMLPGRFGFQLNNYLTWGNEKTEFTWMPLGFGLKIIPDIKDSANNLWQHNFRTGFSLKYLDALLIGIQYAHGFHNTTSESKRFFKSVFSKGSTDIDYLMISGQFGIKNKEDQRNDFLFFEWRGLLSKKAYEPFTNIAILTLGYRKELSLSNTFAAAAAASTKKTRRLHPSIF